MLQIQWQCTNYFTNDLTTCLTILKLLNYMIYSSFFALTIEGIPKKKFDILAMPKIFPFCYHCPKMYRDDPKIVQFCNDPNKIPTIHFSENPQKILKFKILNSQKWSNMFLKRLSFGSKECIEELKLECATFLGKTS